MEGELLTDRQTGSARVTSELTMADNVGRSANTSELLARPEMSSALDELVGPVRDPSRDDDVAALTVRRTR